MKIKIVDVWPERGGVAVSYKVSTIPDCVYQVVGPAKDKDGKDLDKAGFLEAVLPMIRARHEDDTVLVSELKKFVAEDGIVLMDSDAPAAGKTE